MAEKDIGVDVIRHGTVQLHELGTIFTQAGGRKFQYVRAGSAIALGDVLKDDVAEGIYDKDTTAAAADQVMFGAWPNEGDGINRARTAILDNEFFWALVGGDALVKAAATVVAGAPIVTIATAGTVDDTAATAANALASASGKGGIFLTTTTGGFARVQFNG